MSQAVSPPFEPIADGVFVRRHDRLRLTTGLIVGATHCLVVDTRETAAQARDLQAAVRGVTGLPWVVVNTHGHHDHCFGNASFLPTDIWGHTGCARMLREHGEAQRRRWAGDARDRGDAVLAGQLDAVVITPPTHTLATDAHLDLGGVTVRLRHLGRGHTDHDIIVEVPERAVFAGDLVEEGNPPDFGDAFPLDWPDTVAALASVAGDLPVVPGHGAVFDRSAVADQQALLATVAAVARSAHAAGDPIGVAVRELPMLPTEVAEVALRRAVSPAV